MDSLITSIIEPRLHDDVQMVNETDEPEKKVSKAKEVKLKKRSTRAAVEAQQTALENADAIRLSSQA